MFAQSLITGQQHWPLLAVLLAVAALSQWAEKTRWGGRLSGAVMAILGAMVLSNVSLIPSGAPVYDLVWTYMVPLAIPLLLVKADLRRILREAGPTLVAFVVGGVGTAIGTVVAYHAIDLGPESWKMAAIFCSTYIGGAINYVAASNAVGLRSGDLLAAGVAADNLVMPLYFLLLFALPSVRRLRRMYPQRAPAGDPPDEAPEDGAQVTVGTVVLRVGPQLFLFAGLILLIHLAVTLLAGKVLRLDLREIVIASNANMGGPTTAAAMAVARGWTHLVIPAILCGTLGYAVATFCGVGLGHWLR